MLNNNTYYVFNLGLIAINFDELRITKTNVLSLFSFFLLSTVKKWIT